MNTAKPPVSGKKLTWQGIIGGVGVALPYVLPIVPDKAKPWVAGAASVITSLYSALKNVNKV